MACIDLSFSTSVQTQQPKRLSPQLGVPVSTTSGHSPSGEAPRYIVSRSLLSWPQRVGDLHQERPDVVVRPVLERGVDVGAGQLAVRAQAVADAPRLVA